MAVLVPIVFVPVTLCAQLADFTARRDSQTSKAPISIAAGDLSLAKTAFVEAQSELMRAVGKGVVHRNTGSRKVSRLAAQLKKLQVA